VTTDDHEVREVERDPIEIRNRTAGLRGMQRSGVPDLQTERHAELDALRVERIVAAVVRR
jgi:hypothetical protein